MVVSQSHQIIEFQFVDGKTFYRHEAAIGKRLRARAEKKIQRLKQRFLVRCAIDLLRWVQLKRSRLCKTEEHEGHS